MTDEESFVRKVKPFHIRLCRQRMLDRQRNHQAVAPDHPGIKVGNLMGAGHEGDIEPAFADHELGVSSRSLDNVQPDTGMVGVELLQ